MVFSELFVTTVVVSNVGIGRQRIHEQESVRLLGGIAVCVRKKEIADSWTISEDAVLTGGIVVANRIEISVNARVVYGVLEQMMECIRLCGNDVTELAV
jgi:hypothetical protein